ncbi:MAG: PepSY domain-containing protein [Bacteroidales bacterium]|nr:PepSY domain-containing protein [Bacteroidales bacterium]
MNKLFKKLHLWLSLPLGIVMSITCFTGAMLIFENEITQQAQKHLQFVRTVQPQALPMDSLVLQVLPTLDKGVEITGVTISNNPKRAYKINLSKPKRAGIYVDQYTGEVLGKTERLPFFQTMFRLHRWLMDTKPEDGGIYWGKLIVGISTALMVIILITGLVIWIPKNRKSLKNRLTIQVRKGQRRFWYDLHIAGGFYAALLLLAMALTGLTWSFPGYRDAFYGMLGVETKSNNTVNAVNKDVKRGKKELINYKYWETIYQQVAHENPEYKQITVGKGSAQVAFSQWGNQRASDRYSFEEKTGEITGVQRYQDSAYDGKVRGWVYTLHVGNWGGYFSRILWFLAAMMGAALPLSGYYLWFKRMRKQN